MESGGSRYGRRQPERTATRLQEYGHARECLDRIRSGRDEEQSKRDRSASGALLGWSATAPGGLGRQRLRCAESTTSAFRPGKERARGEGGHSVAIRQDP